MKFIFCGDIMPGGVLPYQTDFISTEMRALLGSADFRVGTLECAIGDNIPFDKKKMNLEHGKNIVYAHEHDFKKVQELGFNLVSLANNHIFDLGSEGLFNTIKILNECGILYCGAGSNLSEAKKPCIVQLEGRAYAFIGCCFKSLPPWTVEAATENSSGVFQADENEIYEVIRLAKKKADYVIVLPHWGIEYSYVPSTKCRKLAKSMIDAGADAIVASHTHIMNPEMIYKGKPIYFSLGNFLFPDFCLQVPRPIMYPDTAEEVYNLPIVLNYPKSIDKPVRVVWKKSSRIGVVVTLNIGDQKRIKSMTNFCFLNSDNVLTLLTGFNHLREVFRMQWYRFMYGSKLYNFAKRMYNSRYNYIKLLCKNLKK